VSERIERIKNAVEKQESCRAKHIESLRVQEKWIDEVAWDGVVETFDLLNHPTTQRVYAWERWEPGEEPRYTIIPSVPPVNSARDAVQAAILAVVKKLYQDFSNRKSWNKKLAKQRTFLPRFHSAPRCLPQSEFYFAGPSPALKWGAVDSTRVVF
jgi:hypothetical protein